jgi:adenylosuccinate lyase
MFVYPDRMKQNLDSTGGLIFSGQLLLDLAEAGMSREDAYKLVQTHAMRAWKEGVNFRQLILKDRAITARVPMDTLDRAFDLKRQLRNVDKIFDRVFGKTNQAPAPVKAKKAKAAGRKPSRSL